MISYWAGNWAVWVNIPGFHIKAGRSVASSTPWRVVYSSDVKKEWIIIRHQVTNWQAQLHIISPRCISELGCIKFLNCCSEFIPSRCARDKKKIKDNYLNRSLKPENGKNTQERKRKRKRLFKPLENFPFLNYAQSKYFTSIWKF